MWLILLSVACTVPVVSTYSVIISYCLKQLISFCQEAIAFLNLVSYGCNFSYNVFCRCFCMSTSSSKSSFIVMNLYIGYISVKKDFLSMIIL